MARGQHSINFFLLNHIDLSLWGKLCNFPRIALFFSLGAQLCRRCVTRLASTYDLFHWNWKPTIILYLGRPFFRPWSRLLWHHQPTPYSRLKYEKKRNLVKQYCLLKRQCFFLQMEQPRSYVEFGFNPMEWCYLIPSLHRSHLDKGCIHMFEL